VYFFVGYCEMRLGNYAAAESAFTRGAAARDSTVANISRGWLSYIQGCSWVYLEMFRLFQDRPRAYFIFNQLHDWIFQFIFPVLLLLLIKRRRSIPESIVDVKWGAGQVIILLALIAVSASLAQFAHALSRNGMFSHIQDYSKVSTWALSPLFWEVPALGLCVFFLFFYKTNPVRLRFVHGEVRRNRERIIGIFFGVGITILCICYPFLAGSAHSGENALLFHVLRIQGASPVVRFLIWLLMVVLTPVSEETFFRGVLYASLRKTLSPLVAAVACSVIFAGFHLQLATAQCLYVFATSMGFCLLYEYSGHLWSPIIAHGLVNGVLLRWIFAGGASPGLS
jgi:membrane protease YdiL (CAAX protease family)